MICDSADASFGITGYVHDHVYADYKEPIAAYGTDHLGFDWLVGTIAATLALRFDSQALGVSALFYETRFKVDGLENFDVATTTTTPVVLGFTASPGNVTGKGANMAQGFGVSIGWMGRLAPWLRAGLTWEIPIWQQRLPKYAGFIPHDQRMIPPQRITGGFHFNFCQTVNLVLEAQQILWSMNKLFRNDGFTSVTGLQTTPFGNPEETRIRLARPNHFARRRRRNNRKPRPTRRRLLEPSPHTPLPNLPQRHDPGNHPNMDHRWIHL